MKVSINAFPGAVGRSTTRVSVIVVLLLASALHAADETAPPGARDWGNLTAGKVVVLGVKTPDGSTHDVTFRYCPAGEVVLGDASEESSIVRPMKPFLMMETEMPTGLASQLAPPDVWQNITDRFVKPIGFESETGKPVMLNDEQARQAIQSPETYPSIPLTYINCDEVLAVGDTVSRMQIFTDAFALAPIEAWAFRLPTHQEWIYAARSCLDRTSAAQFPHFSPWPKVPDALRGKCLDQWELRAAEATETFTGSQQQVISFFEKYDKNDNPEPAEILSSLLSMTWWKNPASRVYTESSRPADASNMHANAWGLVGMCDNVCEWVICVDAPSDVREYCARLLNQLDGVAPPAEAVLFLAGGSTRDPIVQKQDWKSFTVWGGQPLSEGGDGVDPRSWESANGDASFVLDFAPGFRFVAERVLATDWIFRVRNEALRVDVVPELDRYFRQCETTINEIIIKEDQSEALRVLASYEAVARYRMHDVAGTRAVLSEKMRTQQISHKKPKITVDDMFGSPAQAAASKPSTKAPVDEDDLFRRALLMVVSAETAEK